VYEQFFYLQYVGGWSFIEAYNLPIGLREWFVKRLAKQIEMENEKIEDASGSKSTRSGKTYSINDLPPGLFPGNE